jgi:ComEC/Rec2-related protein
VFGAILFVVTKKYLKSNNILCTLSAIIMLMTLGYAATLVKIYTINAPTLNIKSIQSKIIADVEEIESRENEKKLLLKNITFLDNPTIKQLKRVRLVVRTKLKKIGKNDRIIVNANLMPPPRSILPNSFDYSRYAYFKGIGAIGYATGNVKVIKKGEKKDLPIIQWVKEIVFDSFYEHMESKNAAIAIALFLGDSKKIDNKTYEEIRISGIAHLLAISGMHIALVASMVFFMSNLAFSRVYNPDIKANNKKISAIITMFFSLAYLLLANTPISAQRAFTITVIVLLGVLLDRRTTPLRALGVAAVVILFITPEALLSASLQMSFSACLSLVYGFKLIQRLNLLNFNPKSGVFTKVGIYFISIVLASVFATLSTSIFIIYHFKNFSTYSVVTNLLAIPLTEFIIMPFGILGMLLIPCKLEFISYFFMEFGIELLLRFSKIITSLPHSIIKINSIDDSCLLAYVLGCISIMILKGRLKYISVIFFAMFLYKFYSHESPDIVISKNAKMVALKDLKDGRLYLVNGFSDVYAKKIWEQELGLKKIDKRELKKICNAGVCTMNIYGSEIEFKNGYFESIVFDLSKYWHKNDLNKITKDDLLKNGTHMIWIKKGVIHIKNEGNYLNQKPWNNNF